MCTALVATLAPLEQIRVSRFLAVSLRQVVPRSYITRAVSSTPRRPPPPSLSLSCVFVYDTYSPSRTIQISSNVCRACGFACVCVYFHPTQQVRLKIEDIKCSTCRDRLLKALGRGLSRGGFPLTKLVKLAACGSGDNKTARSTNSRRIGTDESFTTTATTAVAVAGRGDAGDGRAPVVLSNGQSGGGGGDTSHKTLGTPAGGRDGGSGPSDRLRIRAPVTPDLLRQIISIVQQAVATTTVTLPPAAEQAAGLLALPGKKEDAAAGAVTMSMDLSAEMWLSTYPAPNPALLEANEAKSNGLRGTGTGSLSFPRGSFGSGGGRPNSSSTEQSNPWTLMDRVERARDNAFKCCGVIETSTGGSGSSGTGGGGASSGLLESSGGSMNGGSSSTMANSMEWNPQFAPRLQEAEAALVEWLTELTMALHGLTFQFTLAFVGEEADGRNGTGNSSGSSDLAESTALAEDLWTAYEESVKRQLELTLEARREQLREQSHAMGIALCFAAQNRLLASELLERKRAEMTALHDATVGVMTAAKWRPLLERAEKARQKWSGLLLPDDVGALDELAERVLRARLQVCGGEWRRAGLLLVLSLFVTHGSGCCYPPTERQNR